MRWGGRRHKWRRTGVPIRPIRWVNAADDTSLELCGINYHTTTCEDPSAVELIQPSELAYSDRQTPTLERIVGSINVVSSIRTDAWPNAGPVKCLFRAGLLVVTDDPSLSSYTIPSLFDGDTMTREEWMWLHQNGEWNYARSATRWLGDDSKGFFFGGVDIPVDVRVKRKLSQDSHLLLIHQYKFETAAAAGTLALVGLCNMLRCIVKS